MINILKNSALVMVLVGLLFLPLMGMGVTGVVNEPSAENVLGTTVTVKADPYVVKQIDLDLNLSDAQVQKFYSIVPEEFLRNGYTYLVVYKTSLVEEGVSAKLIENDLSVDLKINLNGVEVEDNLLPITILVLE